MRGSYRIVIQNRRIRYDFEVKRNITILRGDSATGKTALVEMIREYDENGSDSGIELVCDKKCRVLSGNNWEVLLSSMQGSIVFIDEGNHFVTSVAFASAIQKTDNYYVIVARESLPALPYSVDEIYGIRNSGKYGTLKRTYNELYHIYSRKDFNKLIVPEFIITEDSNAGYQFFLKICEENGYGCVSAGGKSNIFSVLLDCKSAETLIVADGAAFGAEMEKIMKIVETNERIHLYLPESFEWLILKSGILEVKGLKDILEHPYNYVESSEDFSWERFFTKLLIDITKNTYLKYTKHSLNPTYLQEKEKRRILRVMEGIGM